jgi:hypothetical protein
MGFNSAMTLIDTHRGMLDLYIAFSYYGLMHVENFIESGKKNGRIFRVNVQD